MRFPIAVLSWALLALAVSAQPLLAVQYVEAPPLSERIRTPVGDIQPGVVTRVPLITWGGDEATILANGNAATTQKGSIFAQKGLNLNLVREDDFMKQLEAYLAGETPYLRGTLGMINMAMDVVSRDARTTPKIIYQLTWSNGGDCLVVKQGIKTARDLKGKTIVLQAYGPHVYYLSKILDDAGLSINDVTIRWVKDLTGTEETPAEAFIDTEVDAAMMIIPDGLVLTSNGSVGTGAEGSVPGASIMLSTKTANRIISDVYAVRSDYFAKHRKEVESFVHGLMLAEEALSNLHANKDRKPTNYLKSIKASARILLDSEAASGDAEALFSDCEYVGFPGNVRFFVDSRYPRSLNHLTPQIQDALLGIGLLAKRVPLAAAELNYNTLKQGLTKTAGVVVPKFNSGQVATVIQRKQQQDTLAEGELFSFEVYFKPNQNNFSADMYAQSFDRVIDLASTYGGAIITIEGHSDGLGYLRAKKNLQSELVLRRMKQAAKNLSFSRANAVRASVMNYARAKGIVMDESQFAVVGHGIMKPHNGLCGADPCPPKTEQEWRNNMRVEFRIIQIEAETSVFNPL